MQIVFDAGKLTGNEMNQCYLLIQQASRVFPNDEVFFFFPAVPSSFTTHCLLIRVALQTTSIFDQLHTPQNSWNIVREIVHLLWAYGQEGHALQKSD
jgi:hypothetical protein